jgi:copper(I)-binding protein
MRRLFLAGLAVASGIAQASVTATDAWVRGTVPAQKTTGAFVTLQSTEASKLVSVTSSAAQSVEMHASEQSQGVMHMHALDAIALPAGQRVELKPGGFHIMLVGLTRALGAGDTVPLTFTFEDRAGKRTTMEVRAQVRPLGQ